MMLRVYSKIYFIILFVLAFTACKTYYPVHESAALVKANKSIQPDTIIKLFYKSYKDSLDKIMKVPIAELEVDLIKKQPESNLGNMMVDILKIKAQEYTGDKIDIAILNDGGIRASSLSKGILITEHAYLLMPFDNYVVEQILTGQQVADLCDSIAAKKGWPVSGISFQIKDKKATNILIKEMPINLTQNYNVAISDYLANGGDGLAFLMSIPQKQTGKLFRDAILEYWKTQAVSGNKISAKIENRITYAK